MTMRIMKRGEIGPEHILSAKVSPSHKRGTRLVKFLKMMKPQGHMA